MGGRIGVFSLQGPCRGALNVLLHCSFQLSRKPDFSSPGEVLVVFKTKMGGFLADLFWSRKARILTSKKSVSQECEALGPQAKELDFEMEACDSNSSPRRQQFCVCLRLLAPRTGRVTEDSPCPAARGS